MITEWMALATVIILLGVTGAASIAAVFGSLASFSVWLGVFAGYKLSQRMNGNDSPLAYVYVLAITAVLRYAEIVFLLPSAGGFSPEADLGRIIWPVVASLMVMACVKLFIKFRRGR